MNFNEVFKIRAVKKNEEDIYVITIGDRLVWWLWLKIFRICGEVGKPFCLRMVRP